MEKKEKINVVRISADKIEVVEMSVEDAERIQATVRKMQDGQVRRGVIV